MSSLCLSKLNFSLTLKISAFTLALLKMKSVKIFSSFYFILYTAPMDDSFLSMLFLQTSKAMLGDYESCLKVELCCCTNEYQHFFFFFN